MFQARIYINIYIELELMTQIHINFPFPVNTSAVNTGCPMIPAVSVVINFQELDTFLSLLRPAEAINSLLCISTSGKDLIVAHMNNHLN